MTLLKVLSFPAAVRLLLALSLTSPTISYARVPSHSPSELIKANGYPSEDHEVTTQDGYVLRINRIPRPGRPVVFLAHQLYCSAALYLIPGKHKAIGFLLHDAGFDVWLGNYRGSDSSLSHTNMSSSDDAFWKFGWHENGSLDNPAMIGYILQTSRQSQLIYLGHSMGGTTFLVTASERPDVIPKIRAAFLMAPASFMGHSTDQRLSVMRPFVNMWRDMADMLNYHQMPSYFLRQHIIQPICENYFGRKMCDAAARAMFFDTDLVPKIMTFLPSGASVWQALHYVQLSSRANPGFRQFDYGAKKNRLHYGGETPPDYNISNINTPVYLYNGLADPICTLADMAKLKDTLTNVKQFFFSPNKAFAHGDFVTSDDAVRDMWVYVLRDLSPFLNNKND